MDIALLEAAGLTRVEARVYLTLLELGSASANDVARKSGIHRRSVYDAMERLIEKGLAAFIKSNNRRIYQVEDPERLLTRLDDQKRDVQQALPQLKIKYEMSRVHQETLFYRGKAGLRTIFDDQIREGKDVLVVGGNMNASEIVKAYFPKYTRMREEKKIKLRILYSGSGKRRVSSIPLSEVRYLPTGFGSLAATNVWGDKVAIILWTENPMAILIKNNEVAKAYRDYFELLWKMGEE